MLKVKVSYSGRCSMHPRFNPLKDGRGGVRAGCRVCDALCGIADAAAAVRTKVEHAEAAQADQAALVAETTRRRAQRQAVA